MNALIVTLSILILIILIVIPSAWLNTPSKNHTPKKYIPKKVKGHLGGKHFDYNIYFEKK